MAAMKTRKGKHKEQLAESRNRGLDRCHPRMRELWFCRFLFFAFCPMDFLQPTHRIMRLHEFKLFISAEPTLSTVDQQGSFKGLCIVD